CYALDKPLVSVSTLKSMASQPIVKGSAPIIIPVLDARRMEVYAAVFDGDLNRLRDTRAEVIDEHSFKEFLGAKEVHFLGSGAKKIEDFLGHDGIFYHCDIVPSAKEMAHLSFKKFEQHHFEDVAYFEPYYLKDFMVQTKQK
ncbi:MAG: tRNA threonylcarbamoyladenosine biosynthesis protein TsaB, partial [Maribacter sp.]